jgi:hypothetical protein
MGAAQLRILALDPAEYKLGWALGDAGSKPVVGVLKLRESKERTEEAIGRFAVWLNGMLSGVDLLVIEHFLPSGALKGSTTADTREGQVGLAYAARAVAAIQRVPYRSPYVNQIRAHFIGKASFGSSDETKRGVVKMAQTLGYISKDCFSTDIADACALYDFASSYWGSKAAAFQLVGM